MADLDLQMREGPGHPDTEMGEGGGGVQKKSQFGLLVRGGGIRHRRYTYTTVFKIMLIVLTCVQNAKHFLLKERFCMKFGREI